MHELVLAIGPLALLAIPAAMNIAGQAANYIFNKPKKPKPVAGLYLRQLQESGLQMANQATANAGLQLGPSLAARGMTNSGVGASVLGQVAGEGAREAVQGAQRGYLQGLVQDSAAEQDYQQQKQAALSGLITGATDTAATNLAGYAAVREEGNQADALELRLREIYGDEKYDTLYGGGSTPVRATSPAPVRRRSPYLGMLSMTQPQAY